MIPIDKKHPDAYRISRSIHQKKINMQAKKRKKKPFLLKIFITFLSLAIVGIIGGISLFLLYLKDVPELKEEKLSMIANSKIFDKDGNLIADLGKEKRELLDQNEIPKKLADAVTSVEDQHFYKHHGIDIIRIFGSALHNFNHSSIQGGSTLTQQLIKLSYFSTKKSDQTMRRKAQEAWLALKMERRHSKQEILTHYLNKVYMGNQIHGVKTAANAYYNKPLKELNIAQIALLAGIPQAPNLFDPYTNPETTKKRRDLVLLSMFKNGKIKKSEYEEAIKIPINEGLQSLQENRNDFKLFDPYLVEVIKEVKEKTGKDIHTDGLNVYTNVNPDAQQRLYDIVNTNRYIEFPDDQMQIAATLIDVKTGKVRAQIGGRHIPEDISLGSNRATQNDRDWGSTMKPMVDYGPAVENLHYSTTQIFDDTKAKGFYPGTKDPISDWDSKYMGRITMRSALVDSRNIPAVQALEQVGLEKANKFLAKIGISYPKLFYSNAISSSSPDSKENKYGVSSLRIAAAYAAFANDGIFQSPYYVEKVTYSDGTEEEWKPKASRAMESSTAYIITDMLKDVIANGLGKTAGTAGLYEAGKTGTSNYSDDELKKNPALRKMASQHKVIAPDENFVGYTGTYSLSVWAGYANRAIPVVYENFRIPGDIYRELISFVMNSAENVDWKKPISVIRIGSELYLENSPNYH
ncbi:MAG: PBP1A family penicillin-binding protein [Lactobacillales bacterium]|nr:PBP1A family penicillin-binding protein [Lactobacillales bacterium]